MANARITDFGERFMLDKIATPGTYNVGLYAGSDVYDDTVETTGEIEEIDTGDHPWYTQVAAGSWSSSATEAGVTSTTGTTLCVFEHNGTADPIEVVGWFLCYAGSDELILFQEFDAPILLQNDGDQIRFNPKLSLKDTLD